MKELLLGNVPFSWGTLAAMVEMPTPQRSRGKHRPLRLKEAGA
jgi:hypothetical protein